MSKIHTHYDNLKVSRMAPPEVIRAAYKALSQKYHPDKNPGDGKAARIMAILNSAYGTLSDPQRRREHDEWIAAEEWEIEWLESTRAEEEAKSKDDFHPQWVGNKDRHEHHYRRRTDPQLWLMLLLCLALGWGGAVLMQLQFNFLPTPRPSLESLTAVAPPPPDRRDSRDNKSAAVTATPEKPSRSSELKTALSAHLLLIGQERPCEAPARPETAPNGENWPSRSGYIDGYKIGNTGGDVRLLLDNSANHSDAMVTIVDQDKHLAVRHLLLRSQEKYAVENLSPANYEVQQQVLGLTAAARAVCAAAEASKTPTAVLSTP